MELHDALIQVSEIRSQIARTETFRGYRAMTFGFSGLLVLVAAALQAMLLPKPAAHMTAYLALWITAAGIGLMATVGSMAIRCRRSASPWTVRLTWIALEQFAPCVVAGALLTLSMVWYAVESLWMLPGLWSILFSLGLFASSRLLPRPAVIVAGYYLIGGAACLALARGPAAFSPWAMVATFGCGQLSLACILYMTLERHDA